MIRRLRIDPIRLKLIRMAFDPRVSRLTREHIANGPGFFPYRIDQEFQRGRLQGAEQVADLLRISRRLTPDEAAQKIIDNALLLQTMQTTDYKSKKGIYHP